MVSIFAPFETLYMAPSYQAPASETFHDNRDSSGRIAYTSWQLAAEGVVGFLIAGLKENVRLFQFVASLPRGRLRVEDLGQFDTLYHR